MAKQRKTKKGSLQHPRNCKRVLLAQLDQIIDWEPIVSLMSKHYTKGQASTGRKAYPVLMLFKMGLLQTWYTLSDYGVEEEVSDTRSFMRFCGVESPDKVPDHSVLSRFRSELTKAGIWDDLLVLTNKQLELNAVSIKQGGIIDASLTATPRKPKGKAVYELTPSQEPPLQRQVASSVDQQAAWVKKGGRTLYGYKRHHLCDSLHGLVLNVHTTSANVHDTRLFKQAVSAAKLPKGVRVYADKGYSAKDNVGHLHSLGLKNGIQKKATRSYKLSASQKRFNKLVGKVRYKVERTFGSIKLLFGGLNARYIGRDKMHGQHVLEAICYNLYRLPRLAMAATASH